MLPIALAAALVGGGWGAQDARAANAVQLGGGGTPAGGTAMVRAGAAFDQEFVQEFGLNFSGSVATGAGGGGASASQTSRITDTPGGILFRGSGSLALDVDEGQGGQWLAGAKWETFVTVTSPIPYRLDAGLHQTPFSPNNLKVGLLDVFGIGPGDPGDFVRTGTLNPGLYKFIVDTECNEPASPCRADWDVQLKLGQPPVVDLDAVCGLPAAGGGVVPAEDDELEACARVTSGSCVERGPADPALREVVIREGEFWTLRPNPSLARASGQSLAPEEMPAPDTLTGPPGAAQALLVGSLDARPEGLCGVAPGDDAQAAGQALLLSRPGPHLMRRDKTTVKYAYADAPPSVQVCPGSLATSPPPGFAPEDEDTEDGKDWYPSSVCTTRDSVHFDVVHPAVSGCTLDGSTFPADTGYLNQYSAGAAAALPTASTGERGGNACGPSSLLMGMRQAKATAGEDLTTLPALATAFEQTMQRGRAPDGTNNVFSGARALAWLQSLGWAGARLDDALGDATAREAQIRASLQDGPVVLSTAFGSSRWGRTGGGHMIFAHELSSDGRNVLVSDPAGDYFSAKTDHYGAAACGRRVSYPLDWLVAFTSGRWLIELGAPGADPPALLLSDVERTAPDAAEDFWLVDGQGRRSGWIGAQAVNEIPGAHVVTDPQLASDPDSDENGLPDEAALRVIVMPTPPTDLQVRVRPGPGGYRLAALRYDGGAITGQAQATGGPGVDQAILIPEIGIAGPPAAPPTTDGGAGPLHAPAPVSVPDSRTLVTLRLARARIPASGPLLVTVANASRVAVTGTLTGSAQLSRRRGRPAASIRLGPRRFRVPAGSTSRVRLTLPRVLRAQLRRTGRLTVRLKASVSTSGGGTRVVSAVVRPRLAGERRR